MVGCLCCPPAGPLGSGPGCSGASLAGKSWQPLKADGGEACPSESCNRLCPPSPRSEPGPHRGILGVGTGLLRKPLTARLTQGETQAARVGKEGGDAATNPTEKERADHEQVPANTLDDLDKMDKLPETHQRPTGSRRDRGGVPRWHSRSGIVAGARAPIILCAGRPKASPDQAPDKEARPPHLLPSSPWGSGQDLQARTRQCGTQAGKEERKVELAVST